MGDDSASQISSPSAVGLYRRGPAYDPTKPLGAQLAVHEHIAHLSQLIAGRDALYAGPFHQPDAIIAGDLVGLVVFTCDIEAAQAHGARDPAVGAGILTCEVLQWYP